MDRETMSSVDPIITSLVVIVIVVFTILFAGLVGALFTKIYWCGG